MLVLLAAACGVGIGTIIALIFAPQKGENTREQIGEAVSVVGHEFSDVVERVKSDVQERVNSVMNS